MAANGHHHGGRSVLVLYRVTNSDTDCTDPLFNCFSMPFGKGATLKSVKQHCAAAHSLSHMGPEGFHWRVLVEDKAGQVGEKSYSWWDIQDGNAKLPVKEINQYELRKLLFPSKPSSSASDYGTKAAKGAFKMMGKMASAVAGDDGGDAHGPPISILCFKLLDLMKATDDVNAKHGGHPPPAPVRAPAPARPAPRAPPAAQAMPRPAQAPSRAHQTPQAPPQRQPEADLMGFGGSAPAPAPAASNRKMFHHSLSSPASINPNEDRWERLKREREAKEKTAAQNRVWDPIDERWVEAKPGSAPPGHKSSGMETAAPKPKVAGIRLDGSTQASSEAGRRGAAERMSKMKEEQDRKVQEFKAREAKRKTDEEQEDVIRRQLDPKIKAWSEEHGKKKQLRALLATLHTILWPGTKWKQITIGDLLDDGKVRRAFLKASLVVHPDKTSDLPPEQRFLAKRIFDALSQAKSDFDNGKNS